MGARHFLVDVDAKNGNLRETGLMLLDEERVEAEWYLWQGERPHVDSYAKKQGYIAVRYNGELFHLTSNKVHFRWFGIIEGRVQQNTTIILEPQHYLSTNGRWGVHPDQSRNRLIFSGEGEKGVEIPLADWGLEFAENLPEAILAAIRAARGDVTGSINDDDYRKRLQDKFGDRWRVKASVKAGAGQKATGKAAMTPEEIDIIDRSEGGRERRRRRRSKTVKVVRTERKNHTDTDAVERDTPVSVPSYRISNADQFEKPWHLAVWAPSDLDGPTVLINADSPILKEIVEYHQAQYPDVYAEEVQKTVWNVFGEVAACKIAHSQKLTKQVPEQELDRDYRSEPALTVALMGLIAEESVISQRLGKLGRKKTGTRDTQNAA